ncbi:glycoside hydrolase family 1 protein [Clostridium intestinale]|uniref:glycoside hydrolase family 1 protein n=1 Tax=Clostridium intestinale TaxID=36845 RepID=UPI0028E7509D|nr:glycoside hydrolase family 1 protein [Clostridium intestinale]
MSFQKGFLWGSSTNAQQFEGAWNEGGKGVSIADVRVIPDMPEDANFEEFKIAADHYHHMEEDIALYGEMGFGVYRFTIAWSRIFPNGNDKEPNEEGIRFYERMLDELEKYKIEPVVTLYAYDLPLNLLKEYDGWMSRQCIDDYLNYVETVVTRFKGRVKFWVPFNEQNFLNLDSEYMTGYKAKDNLEIFQLEHHFNLAYARATKLIHSIDSEAKVGGNVGTSCLYPATCNPADIEACDNLLYKVCYNFGDIYFRKTYTKKYLKNVKGYDISKVLLDGDLDIIASSEPDFLSTTYYMCSVVDSKISNEDKPMNGLKGKNPYVSQTEWGWNIDPYGFKHFLTDLYHRYQLPILILENGMGHRDVVEADGSINDDYRIEYLAKHIERMREAVEDGVEIIGYLTWSATDLYSTREGFEKRYGFVHVEKDDNFKRSKKKSFYWYKKVIKTNGEDLEN